MELLSKSIALLINRSQVVFAQRLLCVYLFYDLTFGCIDKWYRNYLNGLVLSALLMWHEQTIYQFGHVETSQTESQPYYSDIL